MKFPRQAKIFRGELLDAAPAAGVAFLLLIFMQLSSLLYTPGVLVKLQNPAATLHITADGRIHFGTNFYTEAEGGRLRDALRSSPAGPPFDLQADTNTPAREAARLGEFVNGIFRIQPPGGPRNLIGTDHPTVLVAVNFLGQYFFDNQLVGERELKEKFRDCLQAAPPESKDLTLIVVGDQQASWSALTRLAQWAREAGIQETVLAEGSDNPSASPANPSP